MNFYTHKTLKRLSTYHVTFWHHSYQDSIRGAANSLTTLYYDQLVTSILIGSKHVTIEKNYTGRYK